MLKYYSRLAVVVMSLFVTTMGLQAQNLSLQTATFPSLPASSCTNTQLDVGLQLLCGNMTHTGNTFNISGSTITVNISYTIGPICLPVIVTATQNVNLGMIPAGSYSVVINGIENSTIVSTINTSLSVASCCGATAGFTPTKNKVCLGDSVFFNNTSTGAVSYTWYENNVQISTDTNFGKVFTSVGSYSYKLVAQDTGCADSIIKTILVSNTLPTINLGPDTAICPGSTLILDSGGGRDSVMWSDNSTFRSLILTKPGTYYVTVYKNGCSNSDTIVVADKSTPVDLGSDTTICLGDTLTLDATLSGASYTWQDNSNGATFNVTSSGSYYVKRVNSAGCASWDTISVAIDSCGFSLGEYVSGNDISVFPNPVSEVLGISVNFNGAKISSIHIVDMQGRVLKSQSAINSETISIDVSDIPTGVYLCRIEGKRMLVTKKWLKE